MRKFFIITGSVAALGTLIVFARRKGLVRPLPAWMQAVADEAEARTQASD